jgi:hypothetical protein
MVRGGVTSLGALNAPAVPHRIGAGGGMGEAKRRTAAGIRVRRLYAPSNVAPIARLVMPGGGVRPTREQAVETAALAEGVRKSVRAALIRASSAGPLEQVLEAIDAAGLAGAEEFERHRARLAQADLGRKRDMADTACRRGCAFCCHVDVEVTPLEALRVGRQALAAGVTVDRSPESRRPPCPLLVAGACSQYEIRPYACRAVFSLDAARCETGYRDGEDVLVLDWPRTLVAGYVTGEVAALDDLRLASRLVQLRHALAVMSADEETPLRWLNGEDVFANHA